MMMAIQKLLAPIRRRITGLVSRAVVSLVNDSLKLQGVQLQVLADETLDGVERFQEYGFTSVPLAGAEAILMCVGGNRDHPLIVAIDDRRYRKKDMQPGEVALYTDEGDVIHFKRGRTIEITAGTKVKVTAPDVEVIAATKVTVTSPLVTMSGELQVTGKITGTNGLAISGGAGAQVTGNITATGGNITADGIGLKTHVHGGVQTGGGTTGAPQ